jgi:hypothetical protein
MENEYDNSSRAPDLLPGPVLFYNEKDVAGHLSKEGDE